MNTMTTTTTKARAKAKTTKPAKAERTAEVHESKLRALPGGEDAVCRAFYRDLAVVLRDLDRQAARDLAKAGPRQKDARARLAGLERRLAETQRALEAAEAEADDADGAAAEAEGLVRERDDLAAVYPSVAKLVGIAVAGPRELGPLVTAFEAAWGLLPGCEHLMIAPSLLDWKETFGVLRRLVPLPLLRDALTRRRAQLDKGPANEHTAKERDAITAALVELGTYGSGAK